jgi:hypothetical protein
MGRDALEVAYKQMNTAFYRASQKYKYTGNSKRFKQLWAIAKRYEDKYKIVLDKRAKS